MSGPKVLLTHPARDRAFVFGGEALDQLREVADLVLNDLDRRLSDGDMLRLAPDCQLIVSEPWTGAGAELFAGNRKLLAFVRCGVEILNVDFDAATKEGILVVRTQPTPVAIPVAEYTIGLMIMLARGIVPLIDKVASGHLRHAYDPAVSEGRHPALLPGFTLHDEVIGIVGLGEIGCLVARRAQALGMRVMAHDPYCQAPPAGVDMVALDQLLGEARIVSLHAKLTDETEHMIGPDELESMRSDALLINTARGALIDNAALADALNRRRIAGAALDVFEDEPDFSQNPLLACDNALLTPHTAGLTAWSIRRQAARCVEIVGEILAGKVPASVANPDVIARARIHHRVLS